MTKNEHKWITYCEKKKKKSEKYTKLLLVKERKVHINTAEAREKKTKTTRKTEVHYQMVKKILAKS